MILLLVSVAALCNEKGEIKRDFKRLLLQCNYLIVHKMRSTRHQCYLIVADEKSARDMYEIYTPADYIAIIARCVHDAVLCFAFEMPQYLCVNDGAHTNRTIDTTLCRFVWHLVSQSSEDSRLTYNHSLIEPIVR